MEMNTIRVEPILVASYESWNGVSERSIYINDIMNAKVGDSFSADGDNCGRDVTDVWFTVVYKDDFGCAIVRHMDGTTDEDTPKSWKGDDELIWIQFK